MSKGYKLPARIRYEYEIKPDAALEYAHGVWGGVNPHGEVEMNFYTESDKLPSFSERIISPDGSIGHEIIPAEGEQKAVTRNVHSRIVMNYNTARALYEWLDEKLSALEAEWEAAGTGPMFDGPGSGGLEQ
ncbi:hypothetical protein [Desulfovibrio psychrotolerans]|uniref:Uncharacterized protein n=1 Tax=Desulfovibrio psychrotolerans TaxID=415242 RepID=A0A7J0BQ93_9BACT|nr:hypothetical protein [Desulfovibrio psychrotolerans]GFM35808.1 hypothetical protein DSM19430T_04920 [Desulfovibrio psychrotolerans]